MWGQGMRLPQCRQAWPWFSPRAGKRGFFQKGISPHLPHCRWHSPISSSTVARGKAVWHGGDAVAGEERVNPARCCPGRHLGRVPLVLDCRWHEGVLAPRQPSLSQPCCWLVCAAAQPGPLPRSPSVSAELLRWWLHLNCCPSVGGQILGQINVFHKTL